jgi:hypothetical protein
VRLNKKGLEEPLIRFNLALKFVVLLYMQLASELLFLVVGLFLGLACAWFIAAVRTKAMRDARTNLADTFKALSSDALRSNNQSFLELAKTALEKYQETAKGDLEIRQQAIASLVKPVQETLGKLEQNLGQIEIKREGALSGIQSARRRKRGQVKWTR